MTDKDFVENWPKNYLKNGPSLLVEKLRSSDFPLTNRQIAEVLKAIDEVCHFCWDNTSDCQCENDL